MDNRLLEIKDLEIVYQTDLETVHAVNGVDLKLDRGQTLGLVGETGAGKTTMALSLLRLLPRTARVLRGQLLFDGQDLTTLKDEEIRRVRGEKIAMIFQDPMTALNPVQTVGKQIEEALRIHNTTNRTNGEIQARVDEVLELVGIPAARRHDYPHQFSGGMKQRVVIAIALACEPDLLLADEPTTALDVTIQAQILDLINELRRRMRMSVIMITHDLGIIAETCDYVAVMYAGEIIEYGSIRDIFSDKKHHPYTEGLFRAIPNIKHKTRRLAAIDGLMPDPTALPAGCKFSERCPHCTARCREEAPQCYEREGHVVKCHLFAGGKI